ncbi:MAG TPA: phosphatidate cytidylyltransferase, partial [Zeimonas sp.]
MLGKRVATALVLLAILLPPIFLLDPWVWGAVTLVFLAAAAWEWARLLDGARSAPVAAAVLVAVGAVLLGWRETAGWPPAFVVAVCAAATVGWLLL